MVDHMKRLSELNSKQLVLVITVRIQPSLRHFKSLTQHGLVHLSTQPCQVHTPRFVFIFSFFLFSFVTFSTNYEPIVSYIHGDQWVHKTGESLANLNI